MNKPVIYEKLKLKTKAASSVFINAGLIFVLIFSAAFACKNGGDEVETKRTNDGGKLTETIVKQYVREYEEKINSTGGVGTSGSLEIRFEDINFGEPRDANREDELRGAKDGVIYPVSVRYTLIKKYKNEDVPTGKSSLYEFFRSDENQWDAFYIGPAE